MDWRLILQTVLLNFLPTLIRAASVRLSRVVFATRRTKKNYAHGGTEATASDCGRDPHWIPFTRRPRGWEPLLRKPLTLQPPTTSGLPPLPALSESASA